MLVVLFINQRSACRPTLTDRHLYPSRGLHGQVAHHIGRRVVSGAIAEGEILPREAELSEQFAVSRQAVREALKVLAAKGLVQSRRRTGTFVLPRTSWNLLDPDVLAWHPPHRLTAKFFADLVELRRVIEPAAAEIAAVRGKAKEIGAIGAALELMRQSAGDVARFNRADTEFHIAIFSASDNDLIDRLSTILRTLLETSFTLQPHTHDEHLAIVDVHAEIYNAIAAGDRALARRNMEKLLDAASVELSRVAADHQATDPGPAAR